MKRAVKHGFADLERVKAAIDGAYKANADRLSALSPKIVWNGARAASISATVMAKTIVATFTITDDEVLVESKVPFLFSHFEAKIMNALDEHLELWLAKVRSGEA
jgi:hypothetical protein